MCYLVVFPINSWFISLIVRLSFLYHFGRHLWFQMFHLIYFLQLPLNSLPDSLDCLLHFLELYHFVHYFLFLVYYMCWQTGIIYHCLLFVDFFLCVQSRISDELVNESFIELCLRFVSEGMYVGMSWFWIYLEMFFFWIRVTKSIIQGTPDLRGPLDGNDFAFLHLVVIAHNRIQLLMIEIHLLVELFDYCFNFRMIYFFIIFIHILVAKSKLQVCLVDLLRNLNHKVTFLLYDYIDLLRLE